MVGGFSIQFLNSPGYFFHKQNINSKNSKEHRRNRKKTRPKSYFRTKIMLKRRKRFPKYIYLRKKIAAPKSKLDSLNTKQNEQLNLALRKSRQWKNATFKIFCQKWIYFSPKQKKCHSGHMSPMICWWQLWRRLKSRPFSWHCNFSSPLT